ncbi:hypothetical protein AAF712_007531 [Marasmius tenuissimus]|uniref:Uncharacterized protein n=1 Tax=Marasmius tenuissimus TaxID=585030 RepID=A0ABR2ZWP6_9AGAR
MAPVIRAFTSLEDPTMSNTLGATLIGVVGSGILFGMTCIQGFLYYQRFPKDGLVHKVAVRPEGLQSHEIILSSTS